MDLKEFRAQIKDEKFIENFYQLLKSQYGYDNLELDRFKNTCQHIADEYKVRKKTLIREAMLSDDKLIFDIISLFEKLNVDGRVFTVEKLVEKF